MNWVNNRNWEWGEWNKVRREEACLVPEDPLCGNKVILLLLIMAGARWLEDHMAINSYYWSIDAVHRPIHSAWEPEWDKTSRQRARVDADWRDRTAKKEKGKNNVRRYSPICSFVCKSHFSAYYIYNFIFTTNIITSYPFPSPIHRHSFNLAILITYSFPHGFKKNVFHLNLDVKRQIVLLLFYR